MIGLQLKKIIVFYCFLIDFLSIISLYRPLIVRTRKFDKKYLEKLEKKLYLYLVFVLKCKLLKNQQNFKIINSKNLCFTINDKKLKKFSPLT